MAKKKIEIVREYLDEILNSRLEISYTEEEIKRDLEEDVDDKVKSTLKTIWDSKVVGKKTGNNSIDKNIPPYHGDQGYGKPDVMLYNVFGKNEISLIVEDKKFSSTEDPIPQAVTYSNIGKVIGFPCRIVIGNNPSKPLDVRVLVNDRYEPLKINGSTVDYFFGEAVFKLIYDNPNVNEFVLEELIEKPFSQKDFHNIINRLKNIYRQIPEIQNSDDLSINFTVSFVALKMIMEKQGISWSSISEPGDILDNVESIIGRRANREIKQKYRDIFVIVDDDGNEKFNFHSELDNIDVREKSDGITNEESVIMQIYREFKAIPEKDLSIDLFGEVYECLASKKTKSLLGEYFTRRHIIQAIVKMFLPEDEIYNIVEYRKLIADPCCGTGGFLTESFKYLREYCEKNHPELDTSELAQQIIIGYDINNNSIGRTRINMTLAGDGFSVIQRLNSLTSSDVIKNVDYILTNVPYGKGDYAICDPNSEDPFLKANNNKRLEVNFVIKVIEMLKVGGRASIIVPEGLLEAPTLASFREYIFKQCKITSVISLPKFAFAPYTKWKTYVIFLEKRVSPLSTINDVFDKNERVWAYIVDNDGFANSDKRFPTALKNEDGSWKHDELKEYVDDNGVKKSPQIVQKYEAKAEDENKTYYNEWGEVINGKKYGFIGIREIAEKKTIKYKTINATAVNAILKNEANNHSVLSDDNYEMLISNISLGRNGYSVKKDHYIEDNDLKEEFIPIFEEFNIEYDSENNKYYDVSGEETVYALPLVPEKYFRRKVSEPIGLDELVSAVNMIKSELKQRFGE